MSRSWPRVISPTPGRSILITSAPSQARSWVQVGPDWTWVKSRMRTPSSALPACPHGRVLGFGNPLAAALRAPLPPRFFAPLAEAVLALGRSATTFLPGARRLALRVATILARAAVAAVFFFAFLRVAMVVPSSIVPRERSSLPVRLLRAPSFFGDHALRIEIADAAALGSCRRVDHRVDQGRLARVHGLIHGTAQLVGRCHMAANAAECF